MKSQGGAEERETPLVRARTHVPVSQRHPLRIILILSGDCCASHVTFSVLILGRTYKIMHR